MNAMCLRTYEENSKISEFRHMISPYYSLNVSMLQNSISRIFSTEPECLTFVKSRKYRPFSLIMVE